MKLKGFLAWVAGLLLASGCASHPGINGAGDRDSAEVEALMVDLVADYKASGIVGPMLFCTAHWEMLQLPLSVEKVLDIGPSAIPTVEHLASSHDFVSATVAKACLDMLRAKAITREDTVEVRPGLRVRYYRVSTE
jgi:hypothetical protein